MANNFDRIINSKLPNAIALKQFIYSGQFVIDSVLDAPGGYNNLYHCYVYSEIQ